MTPFIVPHIDDYSDQGLAELDAAVYDGQYKAPVAKSSCKIDLV